MPHNYTLSAEKIKKQFIDEYKKINPKSAREYNLKRTRGIPSWATVAGILGVKKWSELIKHCGVEQKKRPTVKKISSIIDLEEKLNELENK